MATKDLFHSVRNLPYRCTGTRGLNGRLQKVATGLSPAGQLGQSGLTPGLIPRRARGFQPRHLRLTHRDVVDVQNVDRVLLGQLVLVDPDDHLVTPVNRRLPPRRGFFNP